MSKINQLRFEATDVCSCHRAALATVDGSDVRITADGEDYWVTAINGDGAMISISRIPDGVMIVSASELEALID